MVKRGIRSRVALFAILILGLSLSSCGVIEWGEEAPAPSSAKLSDGQAPPSPLKILQAPEPESVDALDYWEAKAHSVWMSVRGQKRDELSEKEIESLIRNNVFEVTGDKDEWVDKIISVKRLLGFPGPITRKAVEDWFAWVRKFRAEIRTVYNRIYVDDTSPWDWASIRAGLVLTSEFFNRGIAPTSTEEFAKVLRPLLPAEPALFREAAPEIVRIFINLTASFCGDVETPDAWNGRKVSRCISRALNHFAPIEPWLAYRLGESELIRDLARIDEAAGKVEFLLNSWFTPSKRTRISVNYWKDLAEKIEFSRRRTTWLSFDWITRFDQNSNEERIDPRAVSKIVTFLSRADLLFFRNLSGNYLEIEGSCDGTHWRKCRYKGETPEAKLAEKLLKGGFGNSVLGRDLGHLSEIIHSDLFSREVLKLFDSDGDGKVWMTEEGQGIDKRNHEEAHEARDFLEACLSLYDLKASFDDLIKKIDGRGERTPTLSDTIRPLNISGITELLVFVGDYYPRRTIEDGLTPHGTFATKIENRESPAHLDNLGLTSVIFLLSSLSEFRESYLNPEADSKLYLNPLMRDTRNLRDDWIPRKNVMSSLPQILYDYFPRIYKACDKEGFGRSCGVTYSEILPSDSLISPGNIHLLELDSITASSLVIDSILDRCDRNQNGKLGRKGLSHDSELQCVYFTTREIFKRLVHAQVLNGMDEKLKLYRIADNLPPARWAGEVAMVRGTANWLWLHGTVLAAFHRNGTLGSFLSFAGEVMDYEKSHGARHEKITKLDDPGDEFIFDPNYGKISSDVTDDPDIGLGE